MKKLITIIVLLAVVGGAGGAYYMRKSTKEPDVRTAQITRGEAAKQSHLYLRAQLDDLVRWQREVLGCAR